MGKLFKSLAFTIGLEAAGGSTFDAGNPIGFCIYCGSIDKLTDEHVFPEGLKGTSVLKKASCDECRIKTSYSEGKVLRGPLAAVREHFKLYGKRRARDRPDKLRLEILRKDSTTESIMIPIKRYPLAFRMPRFPAPRFWVPAHADDSDFLRKHDYRKIDTPLDDYIIQAILQADPSRERVNLDMEIFELSKVLAKIAYGTAILFFGPYAIRPYVTDIIAAPQGQAPTFLHYVGGAFIDGSPVADINRTDAGACTIRMCPHDGKVIVSAFIQLLGWFGTPVYEVVIGELVSLAGDGRVHVTAPSQVMKTYRELQIESVGLVMALFPPQNSVPSEEPGSR